MDRPTVLLLFGGESPEHEISISSARNVYAAIDNARFNVLLGFIDRHGKWWLLDGLGEDISPHGAPQLAPVLGSGSFVTFPSSRVVKPDVILPILYGKNGEDGTVQGLAELLHIPIVGCDVTASSICIDKLATKEILRSNDIKVVPYKSHNLGQPVPDFSKLSMTLGSPLLVKPSRAGNFLGSKVYSEEELARALEEAHKYSNAALIEAGITARVLEVAVLGNPPRHQTTIAGEIKQEGEVHNYDEYGASSRSELMIPAQLEPGTMRAVRDLAARVYEILGCQGLAQVDLFLLEDDTIYLNEVNTLPGFTNTSMYAKLWREEGISYAELIERLIFLALGREKELKETEEE